MHPDITYALAEGRIADLHREAAQRRLARVAAPRSGPRRSVRGTWATARTATAGWLAVRAGSVSADPVCCPA